MYSFYSLARDLAGNVEAKTPAAEATIKISIPFEEFRIKNWKIFWSKNGTEFQITGKIDLPNAYTMKDLKKSAGVTVGLGKKDGTKLSRLVSVAFAERGPLWFYRGKNISAGSLNIEKMFIFWDPQDIKGDKGRRGRNRTSWFFIKGNFNLNAQEKDSLSGKATLTLNIPIQSVPTTGGLESSDEVTFDKRNKSLWFYNSFRQWLDWKDNWWDEVDGK